MNYKNIRSLLLVWIAAGVVSCHGDLDIMQDNKLSVSNMWKTSIQVENSTYGIYSAMRDNFVQDQVNVLTWGELRVGEYMWRNSRTETIWLADLRSVVQNTMSSTTNAVSWSKLYTAVDQANAVLKYAPAVAMTDTKRSWAIGQASFARAYLYFWAVRLWGDVPLNLNPIESVAQPEAYPSRAPKASVYAQIGADIARAVENAGGLGTDKYLATADAVNMLKADYALRMYAVQKGGDDYLTMAEEALAAVGVKAGDNRLLTDYAKIFDGYGSNNKNSNEVVFALYNSRDENKTGGFSTYFAFSDGAVDPDAPLCGQAVFQLQVDAGVAHREDRLFPDVSDVDADGAGAVRRGAGVEGVFQKVRENGDKVHVGHVGLRGCIRLRGERHARCLRRFG